MHYMVSPQDNVRRCPIGDINYHTTNTISRLSNHTLGQCFKNCYVMYTSCRRRVVQWSSRDISTVVPETFVRSGLGYQPSLYKMCGKIRRVHLPLTGTRQESTAHKPRVCSDVTNAFTTQLQVAIQKMPNFKRSVTRRLVNCRHGQLYFFLQERDQ